MPKVQFSKTTRKSSLLSLQAMHRPDGSPLPVGEHMCWVLQLEILLVVLNLRGIGIDACAGSNCDKELQVPG